MKVKQLGLNVIKSLILRPPLFLEWANTRSSECPVPGGNQEETTWTPIVTIAEVPIAGGWSSPCLISLSLVGKEATPHHPACPPALVPTHPQAYPHWSAGMCQRSGWWRRAVGSPGLEVREEHQASVKYPHANSIRSARGTEWGLQWALNLHPVPWPLVAHCSAPRPTRSNYEAGRRLWGHLVSQATSHV